MKQFNLQKYLPAIIENLKSTNRGDLDNLNYIDTANKKWQRITNDNLLTLNLNTGELVAKKDIEIKKIYDLLGIEDKQDIFAEIKTQFTKEQYDKLQEFSYIKVPQYDSYLEGIIHTIFGQQVSVAVATKQRADFIIATGKKHSDKLYEHPTLDDIKTEHIDNLKITGNKKKTLKAVLEYFRDNRDIQNKNKEELTKELLGIFGIGQWSVDWFLLKCFNQMDVIPAGDLQVRRVFSSFFAKQEYEESKNLKELENKLYPIGGLLTHCLLIMNKSEDKKDSTIKIEP